MLAKLRSRLSYANVVSTICLFIVLGGTSYAVATGSIDSREIKNGTIRTKDISKKARNALKGRQGPPGPTGAAGPTGATGPPGAATGPAGGALTGNYPNPDLRSGSVGSSEVADNSLRGEDLGVQVRSDRQVDDGTGGSECGKGTDFDECITVFFEVPRPQRLLLVGSGELFGSISGGNIGECRFSVGNLQQLGLHRFGESSNNAVPSTFAMNSVTPVLDAGFYEIGIDCRDVSIAQGNVVVKGTELSVVAVGDGWLRQM